jgi:hypothetical protein
MKFYLNQITRKKIIEAIQTASDGLVVSIEPERRNLSQNAKLWACLHDVASQKTWCGMKMDAEDWKHLFTAALAGQRFTEGLHGGVVVLGSSTSKMNKEQMSELLESIIAWGVENGVKFSDYTERIEENNRGHSE